MDTIHCSKVINFLNNNNFTFWISALVRKLPWWTTYAIWYYICCMCVHFQESKGSINGASPAECSHVSDFWMEDSYDHGLFLHCHGDIVCYHLTLPGQLRSSTRTQTLRPPTSLMTASSYTTFIWKKTILVDYRHSW